MNTSFSVGNGVSPLQLYFLRGKKKQRKIIRKADSTDRKPEIPTAHTAGQVNVNFATAKLNWYACEGGHHAPPFA